MNDIESKLLLEMVKYYYEGHVLRVDNEFVIIDDIKTHWFQFIVYELSYEIYKKLDKHCAEIRWAEVISSDNPIEFLYNKHNEKIKN